MYILWTSLPAHIKELDAVMVTPVLPSTTCLWERKDLSKHCSQYYWTAVESLNNEQLGASHFVLCREVVFSLRMLNALV